MTQQTEKGFLVSLKGFITTYIVPIILFIITILGVIAFITGKGQEVFKWIAQLKHSNKKKKYKETVRKAMVKVEKREEKIKEIEEAITQNKGDINKHKTKLNQLEIEKKQFEQKADEAKKNEQEFMDLVDDEL